MERRRLRWAAAVVRMQQQQVLEAGRPPTLASPPWSRDERACLHAADGLCAFEMSRAAGALAAVWCAHRSPTCGTVVNDRHACILLTEGVATSLVV